LKLGELARPKVAHAMKNDPRRRRFLFGERGFLKDQSGVTAVEYGLLASLIGVVIIASTRRMGRCTRRNMNCASKTMKGTKNHRSFR